MSTAASSILRETMNWEQKPIKKSSANSVLLDLNNALAGRRVLVLRFKV